MNLAPPAAPAVKASLRLVAWLAGSWLVLLLVGVAILRTPTAHAAQDPVSFDRAVFTSADFATQAGFAQTFARPDDFSAPVRAVFVLQTIACALLTLAGGGVLLARLLDRPYGDGRITVTALSLIALGAIGGLLTGGDGAALYRGLTAVACGGLGFGNDPFPPTPALSLVLIPLSLLGSIGVVVICDVIDAVRSRTALPDHAAWVLTLAAGLYVAGMTIIAPQLEVEHNGQRLALADAIVWSARGYGAPVEFASAWPQGVAWATLGIMVVGTGAAGAAGAIGLGWLLTLPARLRPMLINALLCQLMLLSATLLILSRTVPELGPIRRLLLATSATMNVGLSHEPLSITGLGLIALALCCVIGKVLPLVFFAFALLPAPYPAPAADAEESQ